QMFRRQLFPTLNDWQKHYSLAVEQLAATDPILAFRLRHKAQIFQMIDALSSIPAGSREVQAEQFALIEGKLSKLALPRIEEILFEVARVYGPVIGHRVRRQFGHEDEAEFLQEARAIFNELGIPMP